MNPRISRALLTAVLTGLAVSTAAMQPSAMKLVIENASLSGTANLLPGATGSDAALTLLLQNPRDIPLVVVFPACVAEPVAEGVLLADLEAALQARERPADAKPARPEPGWEACVRDTSATPGRFLVRPGEERRVTIDVDFRAAGQHRLVLPADVFAAPEGSDPASGRGLVLAAPQPSSVFYEVRGSGERATFRHVSLDEIAARTRLPRAEAEGFANHEYGDGVHAVALDSYFTPRNVVPAVAWDPLHPDVRQIPGGTGDGSEEPGDGPFVPMGGSGPDMIEPGTGFIVKGRFSVKWTDGNLHPAWGWQVVAWWDDGGDWVELGRNIVNPDGSYWLVVWHAGYSGQNLKVQVRAWSPFFKAVNQDGRFYRFNNPLRTNIGLTQDEGHRWVNAAGHGVDGLGEAFDAGYQLYDEMFFRAKINPIREQPVRVYYPNTWYDCEIGQIWSCASRDGDVWLTAESGTNRRTMQHELGHQMNYEFWNNKLPATQGGAHNRYDCYNRGLALVEGYANFVPVWVQEDRVPGFALVDNAWIESLGSAYCNSPGTKNEGRVAATLWDMHDVEDDGDDQIHFKKEGAVHSIFFNNGVATEAGSWGIDDLRVPYRNKASAPHRTIIDDIFQQNGTE